MAAPANASPAAGLWALWWVVAEVLRAGACRVLPCSLTHSHINPPLSVSPTKRPRRWPVLHPSPPLLLLLLATCSLGLLLSLSDSHEYRRGGRRRKRLGGSWSSHRLEGQQKTREREVIPFLSHCVHRGEVGGCSAEEMLLYCHWPLLSDLAEPLFWMSYI